MLKKSKGDIILTGTVYPSFFCKIAAQHSQYWAELNHNKN